MKLTDKHHLTGTILRKWQTNKIINWLPVKLNALIDLLTYIFKTDFFIVFKRERCISKVKDKDSFF